MNEEKIIPESTKKSIRLLQDEGIYTVIATGRVPVMFDWILKELNIDSYVSMNGQYVVFEGKLIYSKPIGYEMLSDISHRAAENGHTVAYLITGTLK